MTATVQYQLATGTKQVSVSGPDDADVVISAPAATIADTAASVAFMRGKLKAVGDTGVVLSLLSSGTADAELAALVAAE